MQPDGKRVRSSRLVVCAGGLMAMSAAVAQDDSLEEIVVTGSRIARPDFASASPIVSVGAARFEQSSAITVESVLDGLPQFVPAFGSTSNNPSNGGQGNLSLRGLPTTSTLVLLDGRRLMPANGTGVVDVNIIPPMLVESVEVITGGASAVYGSDALAGVVNFKLRRNFEGVEFDAMGGVTGHGDADEYAFGLSAGTDFADGRGSLMGFAGYTQREQVNYSDRKFSRYALVYRPPGAGLGPGTLGPGKQFAPFGSPTIEEGRARLLASPAAFNALMQSYGYAPGTVPYQRDFGFNDDGTLFTLGALLRPVQGGVANFRGERDPNFFNDVTYTYNFAPVNALQLPLERTSFFGRAGFDLNEHATLFADLLYADYSVSTQLAPTPATTVFIPPTNPYISADLATLLRSRSNPTAPFLFSKRMSEVGPRQSENQYDVLQATFGSHGDLAGEWSYEAYLQYGNSDQEEQQSNNVRRSRFEELTFAPDGGVALCGGFDPFGLDSISPKCADYVAVDGTNKTSVKQYIAEVSTTGPVFTLPAGDVKGVVGAMFKRDEYSYAADEISQSFLPDGRSEVMGFNASDDIDSYDYNTDLYVEVLVPLLSDQPWAQSFDAVLGYRWSDYASVGGVSSYKAEMLYRPVSAFLVRGSFQHAVRAPSVYELYEPQLGPTVFIDVQDPCNVGSPERTGSAAADVERLCVAQGVPAELLPTYFYPDGEIDGVSGGNPDLDVETSDTYTVGFVFEPRLEGRWLENLQVAIDWYDIKIEDAIAPVFADDFISRCYDGQFNPDFSQTNTYCSYFARDPATGVIVDAKAINRNIAGYRTSGIDFQFDWRVAVGPGEAGLNWLIGYVDSFEELQAQGIDTEDNVGTLGNVIGGSLPEWKWNLQANYSWAGFNIMAQWRYVDSMTDVEFTDYRVDSQDYLDLVVGYEFGPGPLAGITFRAGVENLTDADPPIYPNYVQANTDPSQYDVLGRRYFVRLNYRL
jgi:outer membrane receptor protein involved in Fe transport